MKKLVLLSLVLGIRFIINAQQLLTPELLFKTSRIHAEGISKDGKCLVYTVITADLKQNKPLRKRYFLNLATHQSFPINNIDSLLQDTKISPDGQYIAFDKPVKINQIKGADYYSSLDKSTALIYDNLDFRHWNHWNDGTFNHVFFTKFNNGKPIDSLSVDLMPGQPYYTPQSPSGGPEDYLWSPDSRHILYVSKKKSGNKYVTSTNTDIFKYDIAKGKTTNLTKNMNGYDTYPSFSNSGTLAWLSMKQDGNEADKQDIVILKNNKIINLTEKFPAIHVQQFKWARSGDSLYFKAPLRGTVQLFSISAKGTFITHQITKGAFEVKDIIGETDTSIIATIQHINRPEEIYAINKNNGDTIRLTQVNDDLFNKIKVSNTRRIIIPTSDHFLMTTWVVYPPDFDAEKKYPSILFCNGGPQSSISLYLLNWNFQLMASMGYIVIIPGRRGVLGEGIEWTKEVSKQWAGLVIKDYLSAIDFVSKEKYIDKNKRACIGPSFGGYSVFMLEAVHNGRFKTFVSHAGIFDLKSMYGTNSELWFTNWEFGGNYWDKQNKAAVKTFTNSPDNFVSKWHTPILITQGGIDYAVPSNQAIQAFQAAQLMGIKSRFIYFPNEGHFVASPQNGLLFQLEIFKWLKETL